MNIQQSIEPHVTSVALHQLTIDTVNPRKAADHVADEIAALAGSIETVGLMEPLAGIVRGNKIGIVAGGRRLAALQKIHGAESDHTVPVVLTEDEAVAAAWGILAPASSVPLNPAVEAVAYRELAEKNYGIADIAKAHATTERKVRQRLKLGALPPVILKGLKVGEISLGQAQAFTIAKSERAAKTLFEQVRKGGHYSEYMIRNELVGQGVQASDRRVTFVTLDAYREAGGKMTEDLFGDHTVLHNEKLLDELMFKALAAASEEAQDEGWGAIETSGEQNQYGILSGDYSRHHPPEDIELPEGDAAELQRLYEAGHDEDDESDEGARMRELVARTKGNHPDEIRARLKVVYYVDRVGELARLDNVAIDGLDPFGEGDSNGASDPEEATDLSAGLSALAAEEPKKVSQALAEDMATIRLAALQSAALEKGELMLDVLGYMLSLGPSYPSPLSVKFERPLRSIDRHAAELTLPAALEAPKLAQAKTATGRGLNAFQVKGKRHRNRVITEALANALPYRSDGFQATLEAALGAEIRKHWTPGKAFFERMPKDRLAACFDEVLGLPEDDERRKSFLKLTIKERAEELGALFESADHREAFGVSKAQRQAFEAWLPAEMKGAVG